LLQVEGLFVSYGRLPALQGVDLAVPEGSVVGVLGPNGAGKSTMLKAIAGLVTPRSGRILLQGDPVQGLPAHEMARRGVCLIPEGRGIFPSLTVADNLRVALDGRRWARDLAVDYFPVLRTRADQVAGTLSGGEQQMLALARAVGSRPALLMADELSLGLAPLVVQEIAQTIRRLKGEGQTILLVDQSATHVLRVADLVYVLGGGRVVWAGEPDELRASRVLAGSYLGA
jgi:branched-chain amino acid transport system ATP-binding protein